MPIDHDVIPRAGLVDEYQMFVVLDEPRFRNGTVFLRYRTRA